MDTEIELQITGLVYNQKVGGTYGLVLGEKEGNRRFSVMIGEPEAQSIALRLNNKKPPRPLTHDLIHNLLDTFQAKLVKILIYDLVNDVFFSELQIMKDGELIVVDARTSDAVALAVRSNCPMFIKEDILNIVGTEVDEIMEEKTETATRHNTPSMEDDLELLNLSTLQEMLEVALEEEKYEMAVKIRDAINRKKNSQSSKE